MPYLDIQNVPYVFMVVMTVKNIVDMCRRKEKNTAHYFQQAKKVINVRLDSMEETLQETIVAKSATELEKTKNLLEERLNYFEERLENIQQTLDETKISNPTSDFEKTKELLDERLDSMRELFIANSTTPLLERIDALNAENKSLTAKYTSQRGVTTKKTNEIKKLQHKISGLAEELKESRASLESSSEYNPSDDE
jgi:chromosome segregation ATPase